MHSGGLLLDLSAGCIMLCVCFVAWLLERGELDRPYDFFNSLEEIRVLLAPPERVNDIFDADAAVFTQQLFDEYVV